MSLWSPNNKCFVNQFLFFLKKINIFLSASAGAPLTTKEKDLLRYYYYIHNGIDTRFVASINQSWFKRIMTMVPRRLLRNQVRKLHLFLHSVQNRKFKIIRPLQRFHKPNSISTFVISMEFWPLKMSTK